MADLIDGASNAPDEGNVAPQESGASSSIRESLERGFSAVDSPVEGSDGRGADRGDGRDATGRFAGKAGEPAPAPKATHSEVQGAAPEAAPVAPAAPGEAPDRFSHAAYAAWAATPPVVKAEVLRMEAELTKGLAAYQQRFEPLKRFDEMARAGGTTLDKALESYTGAEDMMRRDPAAGILHVCQNMGFNRQQVVGVLNEMARRVGLAPNTGQGGEAPAADPRDAHIARLEQQINRLGGQIDGVGKTLAERDREAKLATIGSEIDAFSQSRPRYAELEATIAELLESRYAKNLEDAYTKAEKLHPLPPAPASTVPATPQTRKAALTITGSPASGSNPDGRKPSGSSREALANAFAQVGLN